MKKVVNEKEKEVAISACNVNKYYGFYSKNASCKGFIAREDFENGKFTAYCTEHITEGNNFDSTNTFEDCLKMLVSRGFQVYEFDTYKQLFKWLSE